MSRLVSFICPGCGGEAQKPASALNRAVREGRPIYCGRACFAASKTFHTPQTMRERNAAYREKNRERLTERQRARRRGPDREKLLAAQLDYHYRNREANNEKSRAYHAANKDKRAEAHRRWRDENRDKADLNNARAVLADAMQVARSEVPTDLAEAKVWLWKIQREIRAASVDRNPKGEKPQALSAKHESAVTNEVRQTPTTSPSSPSIELDR